MERSHVRSKYSTANILLITGIVIVVGVAVAVISHLLQLRHIEEESDQFSQMLSGEYSRESEMRLRERAQERAKSRTDPQLFFDNMKPVYVATGFVGALLMFIGSTMRSTAPTPTGIAGSDSKGPGGAA